MERKFLEGHSLAGFSVRYDRVENDYYATPNTSTEALLKHEEFTGDILEPCCGQGHISEVLKEHGYEVISNDLINRGYGETFKDFLEEDFDTIENVVTNPPFKYAQEFIEKSLEITTGKVAMFAKIQLLEGINRYDMFKNTPLKSIYVFSDRQTPLRNGSSINEETGKKWASTMCFAWFVWEHGYEGKPMVEWLKTK